MLFLSNATWVQDRTPSFLNYFPGHERCCSRLSSLLWGVSWQGLVGSAVLPVSPSTALSEHSQCVLSNAVNLKVGINEGGKKVLQNRRGHMREKELRRILLLCGSCPSWCAVDRQDFSLLAFSPKDSSRCAKKAGIKHFNRYFLRSIYPFIPLQYILI